MSLYETEIIDNLEEVEERLLKNKNDLMLMLTKSKYNEKEVKKLKNEIYNDMTVVNEGKLLRNYQEIDKLKNMNNVSGEDLLCFRKIYEREKLYNDNELLKGLIIEDIVSRKINLKKMYAKDIKNLDSRKYEIKKKIIENQHRIEELTEQIDLYRENIHNRRRESNLQKYNRQITPISNKGATISGQSTLRTREK